MVLTIDEVGPAATAAGPTPPAPRRRRRSLRGGLLIWGFALPAVVVYVAFVVVPVVLAAVYSFYNWNGLGPLERFIGLDNYARALADPVFLQAVGNNLLIVVLSLVVQGPLAVGIALLLNRPLRGRTVVRVLIFVPYVLSEVIAALVFKLILQPDGPLDALLTATGLGSFKQLWLADPTVAFWTLFAVLCWKYLGFAILLMLAGLSGIPEELSEAAAIDGAGWWQTQRYVTVPLLGPTIRIWAFLSIIGSLQLFDMVFVLTGGGPLNATVTMASYMVQFGFQRSQLGYGSAIAVILFLISLVFALIYQRFVLRRDLQDSADRNG